MSWGANWLRTRSDAERAEALPASEPDSAPDADPSFTTPSWSENFEMLSLDDQVKEIIDHVKRLRAELASHRAEHDREPHGWTKAENVHAQEGSRGDMTGR